MSQRETSPPTSAAAGARRILIVDDNTDAADSLGEALVDLGYAVEVVYDGAMALAKLESFTPDVALLDLGLPGMDGCALARLIRARERLAGCRLYAITGRAEPSDRARVREAGFDGHLVKPLDLGVVERVVAAPGAAGR
jgi:CheY-like chemotaxis protein